MHWQENCAGDPTRPSGNNWLGNKSIKVHIFHFRGRFKKKNPCIDYIHVLQLLERLYQQLCVMWIIKYITITNFQYQHRRYLCSTTLATRTKLFQKGTCDFRSVTSVINWQLQKSHRMYPRHLFWPVLCSKGLTFNKTWQCDLFMLLNLSLHNE